MSTALSVLPALGVNSCCAAGHRLELMRTTGRVGTAFFEIRDIGCDVGDDSCGLGIEPCDRNGVGHGAMVAPDAGTAFHGVCWVMCEALMTDERIDSPGMQDEDPYELTRVRVCESLSHRLMGIAVGIVAKSIGESQKARSEGGGSSRGRPPGSVHMTRQERSEVPTNLDFGALGGSFGSTLRMRSGISV